MIVPSLRMRTGDSMTPAGRKYAQVNSSSRVHITLTGRFAARANRAASMAVSPVCLPP